MTDRSWARLRRRVPKHAVKKHPAPRDESVDLTDAEYAWWAARDELETGRVPRGHTPRAHASEQHTQSAFESYFSAESLFESSGQSVSVLDETDPYVVLGLPPSATWKDITGAHRRLAKQYHPDRLVDADPIEREASDRRIRDLNVAYMELRRRKGR